MAEGLVVDGFADARGWARVAWTVVDGAWTRHALSLRRRCSELWCGGTFGDWWTDLLTHAGWSRRGQGWARHALSLPQRVEHPPSVIAIFKSKSH